MLKNRNIIVFGDDWGRYPSTVQHLGKVFVRENRLLWIGSLGLRKPTLTIYDMKRLWEKGKAIFQSRNTVNSATEPNIIQLNPFIFPFHNIRLVYYLNMLLLRRTIKRKMKQLDYQDALIFTASPIVGGVIGTLGERSSHYFCLDDFTLFDGAFRNLWSLEQDLVSKVDSCFAISEKLLESRKVQSIHNYFLPQGVDTMHFSPSKEDIALEMKEIKGTVIGFFGLLTTWVDINLIIAGAKRYPDFTFVVLGKTNIDVSAFSSVKNIKYMGEVPFKQLPSYARAFDVGIIPFVINDLTIACNPLKLLEYLSLGIPVVSTNMPEVKKFEPYVFIAETDEEFLKLIAEAVKDISVEKNAQRREIAESLSWRSIADNISSVVEKIEAGIEHPQNP